jgi:hypothetical protein
MIENEEDIEDAPGETRAAPTKAAKEKVPKTSLKKLWAGRADLIGVIDRIMQQTITITWAEALSLSGTSAK